MSSYTSIPETIRQAVQKKHVAFAMLGMQIQKRNVVVIGISPDSGASHEKFAAKYQLPFILLSDPDKAVMQQYNAFGEKVMYGKKTTGVIRSTVWIGPDGKVKKHWQRVANAAEHPVQVLRTLEEET